MGTLRRQRCCYHQKCHTRTKTNIQSNESNWASPYYAHLLCHQSLQWTWWTCSSYQMTCRFHGNAEWNSRICAGDDGAPDHQRLTMLKLFSSSVSWSWPMSFVSGTNPWLTLPFSMIIWGWVWIYHEHTHLIILFNLFTLHLLFLPVLWNTWLQWDPNCEQHNCCIELQNSNPQKLPMSNMRTIVLWCMLLPSVHHVFTKHQAPSTKLSHPHKHILVTGHWIGGSSLPPVDGHPRW